MRWRFNISDLFGILARFKREPTTLEFDPLLVVGDAPEPDATKYKITWVDMRSRKRTKSRGKSKGFRAWVAILGITWHQTACEIGSPEQCLNMPVHGVVLDDGPDACIIVLLNNPTRVMWHGNGFNGHDIGIEIACRAAGVEGEGKTLWLPKEVKVDGAKVKSKTLSQAARIAQAVEATDAQLEGARQLAQYYDNLVRKNDGCLQFVHAHRQATSQRVSDPGSRIWRRVGEWCREELGLSVGPPDFKISNGTALPDVWTGKANGIRYGWQYDGRIEHKAAA